MKEIFIKTYDFGNFSLSCDTPDKKRVAFDGSYLRVRHKIGGEWKEEAFIARPNENAKTAMNDNGALEQMLR